MEKSLITRRTLIASTAALTLDGLALAQPASLPECWPRRYKTCSSNPW
jgi:hypothetical protein